MVLVVVVDIDVIVLFIVLVEFFVVVFFFGNFSFVEEVYIVDGFIEDVIVQFFKIVCLSVILRMFVFCYKDCEQSLLMIGCEFGVMYVVDGSVCCFGDCLCVVVQLIDVKID